MPHFADPENRKQQDIHNFGTNSSLDFVPSKVNAASPGASAFPMNRSPLSALGDNNSSGVGLRQRRSNDSGALLPPHNNSKARPPRASLTMSMGSKGSAMTPTAASAVSVNVSLWIFQVFLYPA